MPVIRLVVAEDSLLVREGLLTLLDGLADVEVVASVGDYDDLLACVGSAQPDVVVTDIRMPPGHRDEGIRAAEAFRRSHPTMGVVVLSQFVDPAYALALLDGGSRGRAYVLKDHVDDVDRLALAIRTVATGGSMIDDEVVDALVRSRSRMVDSPLLALSPRELDVLKEMATGATNVVIAERLAVSSHSVEKHTNAIFAKLHLSEDVDMNRRVKAVLMYLAGRTSSSEEDGRGPVS
jgi:DNA-binding NarL/FixJ family response regulator